MNVKQFYRYVFGFLLLVLVFTGCGSDNSSGEFDGYGSNSGGEFDGYGSNSGGEFDNRDIITSDSVNSIQKTFSYDSTNRVTKEELSNGSYIQYTYDDSGNLISQQVIK